MNRYIRLVISWPKTSLTVIILLTAFFLTGIPRLKFDNTIDAFMPKRDKEYLYYNKVKKIYGNNDLIYILSVTADNLFTPETFGTLFRFIDDLESYITFDKTLETGRLEKLDSFSKEESVSSNDLLQAFDNDPAFQRLLSRKLEKTGLKNSRLTKNEFKKLTGAVRHTFELKKTETIDRIISVFTQKDITGKDDELVTYDLIERDDNGRRILPETPEDFDKLKRRLLQNPSFSDGLYAMNPETHEITDLGIFIILTDYDDYDPITREIYDIIMSYHTLRFASFGQPYVNMKYNDYMRKDLAVFLPVVLMVIVMVFFYNFRSLRGVIIPFLVLCAADIWVLGMMGYLGYLISSVGVSLPPLLIAIGSSYSIHILNQYYFDHDLIVREGKKEGLYQSMTHISTTVSLAGITTVIAFITLTTSNIVAIKEWAVFSAFGVFSSIIIAVTVIPACLMIFPHKKPTFRSRKKRKDARILSDALVDFFSMCARKHSKKVIGIALSIILLSVIGILKLNVETQFLLNFKENDPVRINYNIISQKVGGEIGVSVVIDSGEPDGALDPEFQMRIEKFRSFLTSDANKHLHIGRTDAFGDFLKIMNKTMNNNDESYYRIPEDRMEIMDYLELYTGDDENNDGRADDFEPFIDKDFQSCLVSVRFAKKDGKVMGTDKMKEIVQAISAYLQNALPENETFAVTGSNIMIIKFCDFIVEGQLKSLFFSLCVIATIVFLLFNNVKAGLMSLIPMSTAVMISFGIMGWFAINLDIATSIIAAITIGIGVDDTIHFLNTYRYYLGKGLSIDETIEKTLRVSGKAILFTSFALILGFGVLVTSTFKPLILFGLLMSITMIATTLGALLVLPSVIKVTRVDLADHYEKNGFRKYINLGRVFGLE